MSYWERLLSSAPDTTSWPPDFVKATIPRLSPRLNKKRLIRATSTGRLQQSVPTKRRPSVLGGGFSTAILSSSATCPLGEDADPGFRCKEQLGCGARRSSLQGMQLGGRNGDENDAVRDDDSATLAEVSVVGMGDRHRRRSSLARELSNRNILVLGDTTANLQQPQWANEDESDGCTGSDGRGIAPGRAGTTVGPNPAAAAAAYVDIVSRDPTGSEAGSVSISVEYAPDIFTKCPEIKPPPFESKEVDQPASGASFLASASPCSDDGLQTSPTCSLSTPVLGGGVSMKTVATPATRLGGAASAPSLSALSSFDRNSSDDISSRFPGVQQETWGWGRRATTAKEHWGGVAPAPTATANAFQAGGTPKVFHNFVFRRNKRHNGSQSSSSSSPSLKEGSSLADACPALASRDDCTADCSASAAGTASHAGRQRCDGTFGSSVTARSASFRRQRSWETPSSSNDWDRPERVGQAKRTCPPPRTPSDAFSVLSFGSNQGNVAGGGDGGGSEGGGGGSGGSGGGCCFGGPGNRPVKCQRCGSFKVHLFATSVSTGSSLGYLRQPPPAGGGRRAPVAPVGGSRGRDGCRSSTSRSSGSPGRRSLGPISSHGVFKNGAMSRLSPPNLNNLTGWSDAGRPTPSPGERTNPNNGGTGGIGGVGGGGGGGIETDPRRGGRNAAVHLGQKASVRPSPLGR